MKDRPSPPKYLVKASAGGPRPRRLTRRRFLKALAALTFATAGGYGYVFHYASYAPVVTRRTLRLDGLPGEFSGLRIVQLTDLHHSEIVPLDYLEACVERANRLQPDLVFLTGDYVTMDPELGRSRTREDFLAPLAGLFAEIRARRGVFAVMGNHDVTAAFHGTREVMAAAGIPLLQDANVHLESGGARLAVVGLRDFGTQMVNTDQAFDGVAPDEPALVLMHNPDLFPEMEERRSALIFAGHTHGGQVRVPCYGPLPRYIPSRYGSRYAEGVFRRGNLTMLVNRGVGMIRAPVRFNCRPEIALVTLEG